MSDESTEKNEPTEEPQAEETPATEAPAAEAEAAPEAAAPAPAAAEAPAEPDPLDDLPWKERRRLLKSREPHKANPQQTVEERAAAREARRKSKANERRKERAALDLQADGIHNRGAAEAFARGVKGEKAHAPTVVFWAPRLRTCSARITRATEAVRISAPSASTMGRRSGKRSWPQM